MNLPFGKFVNTKVGDISFGFEATSGSFVIGLIALISPGYGTDGEKNDSSSISVIQYFEIFMNRKLCIINTVLSHRFSIVAYQCLLVVYS